MATSAQWTQINFLLLFMLPHILAFVVFALLGTECQLIAPFAMGAPLANSLLFSVWSMSLYAFCLDKESVKRARYKWVWPTVCVGLCVNAVTSSVVVQYLLANFHPADMFYLSVAGICTSIVTSTTMLLMPADYTAAAFPFATSLAYSLGLFTYSLVVGEMHEFALRSTATIQGSTDLLELVRTDMLET